MASTDSLADNTGFARKNEASFPVLADEDKSVSRAYGVLGAFGMAKRWTFYIDPAGIIQRIDRDVKPRTAGETLVRSLRELDAPLAATAAPGATDR